MSFAEVMQEREGYFEIDPRVEHHFSDGLYAKRIFIPQGFEIGQHAHEYSHLSILAKGRVLVKTDQDVKEYTAPACIEIKSKVHHVIEALEDSEWYCIHATEETNIEKIDQVLIERN